MQRVLLAFALCAFMAFVCASSNIARFQHLAPNDLADFVEWKAFKQKFDKTYATHEEEVKRFAIFQENLRNLEREKSSFTSMKAGVTKFFDLTMEEFRQHFHPLGAARTRKAVQVKADLSYLKDFPETWDWEKKGFVTPVKNEGQCGSTWAMAAIDVLESVCKIAGYPLTPLSTQQVLDCDNQGTDQGCNGGFPSGAYQYIIDAGGIESESNYPYQGQFENCTVNSKKFSPCHVTSYKNITIDATEENLMQFVYSNSPVVICLDAAQSAFQFYTGGVITGAECIQTSVDHCVDLVGWDWIDGKRVWRMKNQWGTNWGMDGYVYLEIGTNTCGMDDWTATAPCVKNVC